MIVVEERMMDLFVQLPEIQGFKPIYHFGDSLELNAFIKGRNEQGDTSYPLIYQTSYRERQMPEQGLVEVIGLEMFIAVQTQTDLYNTQRWATSYRNILMPTFQNIHTAFRKSNIITSEYDYDVEKFPNYGNPDRNSTEHVTIDIIDALRFRVDVTINNNCITKNIKF